MAQAAILWSEMKVKGVTNHTVLALDFVHFCTEEGNINELAAQLSEDYTVKTEFEPQGKAWLLHGTTRPEGITLEQA